MTPEQSKALYLETLKMISDSQPEADNQYKKVSDAATTNCDINQIVSQIQTMNVVRNRGGEIIGYDYRYTPTVQPDTPAMEVDSNSDNGTQSGHLSSWFAGTVDSDPDSSDKIKGGGFISGLISSAWAGVSALAKFGKNVTTATGEAIAGLAESFGEAFGNLLVDAGNITGDAVRALFGIDNQGNTKMYLDEDVIGALGIAARDNGFLGEGGKGEGYAPDLPSGYTLNYSYSYPMPLYRPPVITMRKNSSSPAAYSSKNLYTSGARYVIAHKYSTSGRIAIAFLSDTPFTVTKRTEFLNGTVNENTYNSQTVESLGSNLKYLGWHYWTDSLVYHISQFPESPLDLPSANEYTTMDYTVVSPLSSSSTYTPLMAWDLAAILKYGEQSFPGNVPGVTPQDGATTPVDAITGADPHVVASQLANMYPQIMGSPIQIVTMDDSCNEITKNYYAVPISYSPTNLNITAPITGGTQVNPTFNPDVSIDLPDINLPNYIDQIIKVLGGGGAGENVTNEPIIDTTPETPLGPDTPSSDIPEGGLNPNIPQTGTGETPEWNPPSISSVHMWRVYNPNTSALTSLAQWLWTNSSISTQWAKIMQNPIDGILGLHAIYAVPERAGTSTIVVGNLDSEVGALTVSNQYKRFSCGDVWLTEYFGNVFDYAPYTTVKLYLPFIGIVDLDVNDVMRSCITVYYTVDFFTGACIAEVFVYRDGAGGILYQYNGSCAVYYPVTNASYIGIASAITSIASGAVASAIRKSPLPLAHGVVAGVLQSSATELGHSGSFSGNAGAMGIKKPYLIITRPQIDMAINFEAFDGLPANKQIRLNECHGYTKCKEVHLNVTGAYKSELDEIERLLREGVIL